MCMYVGVLDGVPQVFSALDFFFFLQTVSDLSLTSLILPLAQICC